MNNNYKAVSKDPYSKINIVISRFHIMVPKKYLAVSLFAFCDALLTIEL